MNILKRINFYLPNSDQRTAENLLTFLQNFGEVEKQKLIFSQSNPNFIPLITISFTQTKKTKVVFDLNNQEIEIELINTTGEEKQSPHTYTPITMEDFLQRIKEKTISELDHCGFDLPWFKKGIHQEIAKLRDELKNKSLYYLFPTGEPWDFIIPGTEQEISSLENIDLTTKRRPKFEIVSLDKTSTPLIQFDFMVKESYQNLAALFPEAIHDPELKNMWVYILNPFGIDICLVLNEYRDHDWGNFFKNHRLT